MEGSPVEGASVVASIVKIGVCVLGSEPSAGVILISAQFTKVSCCFPSPTPQLLSSSQPQLFPTVHHHCSTQ